jgi:lysozyme
MMGLLDRIMARVMPPKAAAAPAPKPVAPVTPDAAAFVAQFEGFRAAPYLPTPRDVPTIGYGTTRYPDGRAVALTDPPCTEAQGRAWLAHDLAGAEAALRLYVSAPLTPGQRVALLSLVYNIGTSAFSRSTLLRLLNAKRYAEAAGEFSKWVHQGDVILPGLVKRRKAEAALFNGAA